MIKQHKIVLALFLASIFLVMGREFLLSLDDSLQIFGEKNALFVRSGEGNIVFFGEESQSIEAVRRAVSSYFSPKISVSIDESPAPVNFQGKDFSVQVFSENFARGNFGNQNIFFIGEMDEDEEDELKLEKFSFESDYWVLKTNYFPRFISPPEKAILFLGERKPAKSLSVFARNNKIPLVSFKETGGFWLKKEEVVWELRVRK